MSNSMTIANELFTKELKMAYSIEPRYLAISEHSLVKGTPEHIKEWLMLSLEASRVSHSAMQENEQEKTIVGICGEKHSKSYIKYDPDSHSWRMSQGCFPSMMDDISDEYLQTWARAGTMYGGECYRQPKWELRINEIGSGFWLTPSVVQIAPNEERREKRSAMRAETGRQDAPGCLLEQVATPKFYPTPTARATQDCPAERRRHSPSLESHVKQSMEKEVKKYPTPDANMGNRGTQPEWKPVRASGHHATYTINQAVRDGGSKTQQTQPGQLNPNWVEWLMGWIIGWTDLKPLEMDKFHQWLRQHGVCSAKD